MVSYTCTLRKDRGGQCSLHSAEIGCIDVPCVRLFFGSGFTSDAIWNPSIFCQVCFIRCINDHFAGVTIFCTECAFVVALACDHPRDTIVLHFHIDGHFVEPRCDHRVFGNHFRINVGGRMRLPSPTFGNIPVSRVVFQMGLHQRIICHLAAMVGFYALAEFLHHSAV